MSGIENIDELVTIFRRNEEDTFSLFNYIQVRQAGRPRTSLCSVAGTGPCPVVRSSRRERAESAACLPACLLAPPQTVQQEIEWTLESHATMQEEMKVFEKQQREEDEQREKIIQSNNQRLQGYVTMCGAGGQVEGGTTGKRRRKGEGRGWQG